jgi:hypothetical protein
LRARQRVGLQGLTQAAGKVGKHQVSRVTGRREQPAEDAFAAARWPQTQTLGRAKGVEGVGGEKAGPALRGIALTREMQVFANLIPRPRGGIDLSAGIAQQQVDGTVRVSPARRVNDRARDVRSGVVAAVIGHRRGGVRGKDVHRRSEPKAAPAPESISFDIDVSTLHPDTGGR